MARALLLVICLVCVLVWACASSRGSVVERATPRVVPTRMAQAATPEAARAASLTLELRVAAHDPQMPKYRRSDWKHWTDADGDCQDARQETLIAESTAPVTFEGSRRCRVESGRWVGPYTGTVVRDPGALDIDHMVPLANAHRSGGHSWTRERKEEYANYLDYGGHLTAATARANRAKGANGPEGWRPPDSGYWCQYALDWMAIKREWGLSVTEDEAEALREMADTCDANVFIQTRREEPPARRLGADGQPTATPTAGGASDASAPAARTPNPTATSAPFVDLDCSDFDSWAQAQAFFEAEGGPAEDPHRLDRDGDGIACASLSGAP